MEFIIYIVGFVIILVVGYRYSHSDYEGVWAVAILWPIVIPGGCLIYAVEFVFRTIHKNLLKLKKRPSGTQNEK